MYHDARRVEREPPRRVMVVGSPGAGKTKLGEAIAQKLHLPFYSLERFYWRPGWQEPPPDDWRAEIVTLAAQDEWVMSGTFPATLDLRVARADWFVYLDIPMPVCLTRVLRQMLARRRSKADEIAPGCPPRFDAELLRLVWNFPAEVAPRIASIIARERRNRTIFILRTARDVEDFLARVPVLGGPGTGA